MEELEPNTKIREWQVKERWGIDQIKLAEYVFEKGLRAADINGRWIRLDEFLIDISLAEFRALREGKEFDADDEFDRQLERWAPRIAQFISDDIINFERDNNLIPAQTPAAEIKPIPQIKPQAENYFKKNGDYWHIKFEGKESTQPIKHVVGMLYISYLLDRPKKSISCIELWSVASGNVSEESISKNATISEDLHTDHKRQKINTYKADQACNKNRIKLENELQELLDINDIERTPEDNMRIKEIEKEIDGINTFTKGRNFNDENSKKQSLIIGNLKTAYANIDKDSMMSQCVAYLCKNIRSDGVYGYEYTGDIKWDVICK